MEVAGDWLQSDPRDPESVRAAREEQRRRDVEQAQIYLAAFSTPPGKKLLEMWDTEIANLRVSVNATLSEYVAAESYRNFVRKIHEKIRLAITEGKA
jgi:hypothetical protein